MPINFYCENVQTPKFRKRSFITILELFGKEKDCEIGELNFIFCNDQDLLKINVDFLKHDYFTDIVTFDYCKGNIVSGDIYVSVERVLENSKIYNVTFENELIRVMSHGFFHLLKFDDFEADDKEVMRDMEEQFLGHYFIKY